MENEEYMFYKACSILFEKRDGHFIDVHVIYGGSEGGVDYIYDADVSSIEGAIDFIDDLTNGVFDSGDLCGKYENAYKKACNY